MESPLISVIVPVYKVEQYLEQCVYSIINQTYRNLEIILVDDGSPDNCPAMCDKYAEQDARITVLHQKNQGQAAARNNALDRCKGEYIAFVDSDDWLEENAYNDMMRMITEKDLSACFCAANIIERGEIKEIGFQYYSDDIVVPAQDVVLQTLVDKIGGQPWLKLYHRQCWEGVRFPTGRIYEDLAVSHLPFRNASKPVGFLQTPLYNYRRNSTGTSLSKNPIKPYHIFLAFQEHYEYARRHCPEVEETCLMKTASFAISAVFNYYCHKPDKLKEGALDAEKFLQENKLRIKACRGYMKSRKIAIEAFYFSPPLFRVLVRFLHKFIQQA